MRPTCVTVRLFVKTDSHFDLHQYSTVILCSVMIVLFSVNTMLHSIDVLGVVMFSFEAVAYRIEMVHVKCPRVVWCPCSKTSSDLHSFNEH